MTRSVTDVVLDLINSEPNDISTECVTERVRKNVGNAIKTRSVTDVALDLIQNQMTSAPNVLPNVSETMQSIETDFGHV